MRAISIFLILLALVLALFLVARFVPSRLSPARALRGNEAPRNLPVSASKPANPAEHPQTNPPTELPKGFYVGEGGHRIFVKYNTADPVLRWFLKASLEDSSDPDAKGRQLFLMICAACHQRDGEGKDGVAPPLIGSEWILAPGGGRLVRIVLNGLTGPIQVRGQDWNQPMPSWRANLDDDQVAAVLTYVRSQVGTNRAGPITAELVAAARQEARATPETAAELLRISDQ